MKRFVLLLFFFTTSLYSLKWEMGFNFEYGVFSVYDTSYNLLRFCPKIGFENFKLCFGMNFIYETNGNFLNSQWNNWQMILSRLEYIQFDGNIFFLDINKMESFTLEDGLLLRRISTRKFFPLLYYPGGITGVNFDFLSFQFFTENIVSPSISGGNLTLKPLSFFTESIWGESSLNLICAVDLDPYSRISYNLNTKEYSFESSYSNQIFLYSLKGNIPLLKNKFFNISLNGSYAGIYNKGSGLFIGIEGLIYNILKYRYDYGFCGEKFLPHYIDVFYDRERRYKFDNLEEINQRYDYHRVLAGIVLFEEMMNVNFEYERELRGSSLPSMYFYVDLDKKYFKVLDLKLGYFRPNLEKAEDFFIMYDNNSYMFICGNFFMSENINFGFEYRYYFHKMEEDELKYNSIYLFLTSFF